MLNLNASLNRVYAYISGYSLSTVSGNFRLQVSASMHNSLVFATTVSTSSNCRVQYLAMVYLFVDLGKFNTNSLYIYTDILQFTSASATRPLPTHFNSFGHTILGMTGLRGQGTQSGAIIRFSLSLTNTSLNLAMTAAVINTVNFTYLFLAYQECHPNYPYFSSISRAACVVNCSQTETSNPTTMICEACDSSCLTCTTSKTLCTSCAQGYRLNGTSCQKI